MSQCPKSVYKDERHDWHTNGAVLNGKRMRLRVCGECSRVEAQQLTGSGSQAGDIWTTVAVGQLEVR